MNTLPPAHFKQTDIHNLRSSNVKIDFNHRVLEISENLSGLSVL